MDYAVDSLIKVITEAVASDGAFADRMLKVIDHCEHQNPHPDWQHMRRIAFASDEVALKSWLPVAFARVDGSLSIKGLWFGLNNPVRRGVVTADIYVGASEAFDSASLGWATELIDVPKDGYLRSKVLREIYALAYERSAGLENDAEYPLVLAYGAMCARVVLESITLEGSLSELQGAACGFDSGDVLSLGRFDESQFHLQIVAS